MTFPSYSILGQQVKFSKLIQHSTAQDKPIIIEIYIWRIQIINAKYFYYDKI